MSRRPTPPASSRRPTATPSRRMPSIGSRRSAAPPIGSCSRPASAKREPTIPPRGSRPRDSDSCRFSGDSHDGLHAVRTRSPGGPSAVPARSPSRACGTLSLRARSRRRCRGRASSVRTADRRALVDGSPGAIHGGLRPESRLHPRSRVASLRRDPRAWRIPGRAPRGSRARGRSGGHRVAGSPVPRAGAPRPRRARPGRGPRRAGGSRCGKRACRARGARQRLRRSAGRRGLARGTICCRSRGGGGDAMTATMDLLLFIVLPYAAAAVCLVATIERYSRHGFSVTSMSSQFLENRLHFWAMVPFHAGLLIVLLGHLVAFLIPRGVLAWNAVPARLLVLESAAFAGGLLALGGFLAVIVR